MKRRRINRQRPHPPGPTRPPAPPPPDDPYLAYLAWLRAPEGAFPTKTDVRSHTPTDTASLVQRRSPQ